MIATPKQIRTGIAANITRAMAGIQVSPYPLANATPPSAYVESGPTTYDLAMGRGHDEHTYKVIVYVSLVTDIGAQELLDEYMAGMGGRSIKAAVETDKTLGGIVDALRVTECSGSQIYTFETISAGASRPPVLGAEWTVEVLAGNH